MRASTTGLVAFVCAAVTVAVTSPASALADHAGPRAWPNAVGTGSESDNWSGYAATGFGLYTSVSSTWKQPAVTCKKSSNNYASFWVGLDGDTTGTVEQTGTEANCESGKPTYGAWYEMFPKAPVGFPASEDPVAPEDEIKASVTSIGGGEFVLSLSDVTKGWTATETKKLKSAKLSSAEVIAEAPSGNRILPLADFGTISFSEATINEGLISNSLEGLEAITMATNRGVVKAVPSAVRRGAFTDTWKSS